MADGDAPAVTSISSSYTDNMAGGAQVQLTGTGFTGATAVLVSDRAAPAFTVDSDTQITFTLPDYSDYSHGSDFYVLVTTNNGTSERNYDARIQYGTAAPSDPAAQPTGPAPTVTALSHNYTDRMDGFYTVQATGTGFTGATAVLVSDRAAPAFTVDSDTQITFTLPDYSDYSHGSDFYVLVTTNNGTSERNYDARIQYGTAAPSDPAAQPTGPAPTVTALSHNYTDRMDGFYTVQATGTGFTGATAVLVSDRAAPAFTVDSDTQITFTLPDYSDYSHGSDFYVLVTTNNGTSERNYDARIQYGTAAP